MCIKKGKEIVNNNFENRQAIEKLYELFEEEMYENTEVNNEYLRHMIEKEEQFCNDLTKRQQEEFNEINELKNKNFGETDKNIFVFAFKLGARIMFESIN